MAKNESRKIKPTVLEDDIDAYQSLLGIDRYAPANAAYEKPAMTALYNNMVAKQAAVAQAEAALDAARDDGVATEWAFHNGVLGARDQVGAQFGKDSNEFQSMGLKKKSEYKKPTRKGGAPTA
jgi:hypothetical protein